MEVCIVIVSYNGMAWLKRCLGSCGDYPVVVVDNASNDGTVSFIRNHYPHVVLLPQADNLGFGQANNLGISYALNQGAGHVFLLNQDAYLEPETLATLLDFQKSHPEYWVLSPVHVAGDGKYLDRLFSLYMDYDASPTFYSDFVLGRPIQSVYKVPFVNAAAWLVSRACLSKVGGFDPIFFHYGEDNNYCQRVRYHGGLIGVLPHVFAIHDRQDRAKSGITPYSTKYYEQRIRKLKNIKGDVNVFNEKELYMMLEDYAIRIRKALLMGRFKLVKRLSFEQRLYKAAIEEIRDSVEVNRMVGPHYLDF